MDRIRSQGLSSRADGRGVARAARRRRRQERGTGRGRAVFHAHVPSPSGPARRHVVATLVLLASLVVLLAPAGPAAADDAPPAPVTGLSASDQGGNTLLTFTYSVGGGLYPVDGYRATCELQGFEDIIRDVGIQNVIPMRLPPGSWLCSVQAKAEHTISGIGTPVVATSPAITVPTGFTAVADQEAAQLQWDSNIGGSIDGYRVTSTPALVEEYVPANFHPATLAVTVPFGVARTYTVTPYRDNTGGTRTYGPGVTSGSITVLPVADAPTITDTWVDSEVIEVEWTPPVETAGQPILGYDVTWYSNENDVFPVAELPATARSVSHSFIPGANEFRARIRARTANGLGFPVFSEFLNPGATPDPVERLFVSTTGITTTFSWDTPGYVPFGHPAHRYRLELSGQASDAVTVHDTSLAVPSLSTGWYQVRVRMLDGADNARWVSRHFVIGDPPCDSGFPDVTSPPFCTPVTWLTRSGIGSGFDDGTFRPSQAVSRQAMASFLYRASGSPRGPNPTCTTAPFPDVPAGNQFCGYIDWLVDEGIAGGFVDGTFKPTQAVSRQAMAAFLVRASEEYDEVPCTSAPFPDVPATNSFCPAITELSSAGVAGGFLDGTFRPTVAVSRGAMAAFLLRWHP